MSYAEDAIEDFTGLLICPHCHKIQWEERRQSVISEFHSGKFVKLHVDIMCKDCRKMMRVHIGTIPLTTVKIGDLELWHRT